MAGEAALRILLSEKAKAAFGARIGEAMGARRANLVTAESLVPGDAADFEVAFLTRDVTGLSTKFVVAASTQAFYDRLRAAPALQWVQMHSAGADRPIFGELNARGVTITNGSGANAPIVAQSAIAGLLAIARHFPELMAAQKARTWAPLLAKTLPRDLIGQTAVVVGWGPIGQELGRLLTVLGLKLIVVRSSSRSAAAGIETVAYESLRDVLPRADWLLLACPLTDRTRGLVDARALAVMPAGAGLVNVARGEVVVERELVAALQAGRLAKAYLDVFETEPLPADSPLWALENVILTPHCAGQSDGNNARIAGIFLDNLRRRLAGQPMVNVVDFARQS
jgi:phosphoglycerate dehydrogenase-like enzyme